MQKSKEDTALVWFKNNLRVQDNASLREACSRHKNVVGIFYFDPLVFEKRQFGFRKIEKYRAKFLIETVRDLKKSLRDLNISLLVYYKAPSEHLKEVVTKHGVRHIYFQNEWTHEEKSEISTIKASLPDHIEYHATYDQFLIHPEDIGYSFDAIPNIFTVFRKHIEKNVIPCSPSKPIAKNSENLIDNTLQIPTICDLGFHDFEIHPSSAFPFHGGETTAIHRLNNYFFETKKLGFYKKTRNGLIGRDYSSKFSPWLSNGSISPRTIYEEVKRFENQHFKNQSTYWLVFELLWRDYFKYISLKFANKIFLLGGILDRSYPWNKNQEWINNWINGETEEPFVNANMLELKHTGWMSNRGRQNVASYFARTLQLDWRIGAAYFEALLLDYDVHSNYGNWMYVSGVGNDPRNRVFNVKLQAERYDAKGTYQRTWLQPTLFGYE